MLLPMKAAIFVVFLSLSAMAHVSAIPQNFSTGGFVGGVGGPEGFPGFVDINNWQNNGKSLPGEWEDGPSVEGEDVYYLKGNPRVLGSVAQRVAAVSSGGNLKSLSINYIDAGAFFGYRPEGSSTSDEVIPLRDQQRSFAKLYKNIDKELRSMLGKVAEGLGQETPVGRTAVLRSQFLDYKLKDFVLRYAASEDHSINLTILKNDAVPLSYVDSEWRDLSARDLKKRILDRVNHSANGDVFIEGIPVFRQGPKPYCAVSTLGMVTHAFGLRLGVDALAAGAQMKNSGSAAGSKMLELYSAAAEEAGLRSARSGKFDFKRAQKAIEDGFPVIVWRRYDEKRDRLHTKFAEEFQDNPVAALAPADSEERATWPGDKAPGHASIINGINLQRGEVIFLESWGEHTRNRRMRFEEMEATSYMAFYFKL
jgi:hypothetical protein